MGKVKSEEAVVLGSVFKGCVQKAAPGKLWHYYIVYWVTAVGGWHFLSLSIKKIQIGNQITLYGKKNKGMGLPQSVRRPHKALSYRLIIEPCNMLNDCVV